MSLLGGEVALGWVGREHRVGTVRNDTDASCPSQCELRPRLCTMKKGPNGYGFNLHSDKSKPGQFIRAVDPDSPAEASGLRAQDRIVEVKPFTVFSRLFPPKLWCSGADFHHVWFG